MLAGRFSSTSGGTIFTAHDRMTKWADIFVDTITDRFPVNSYGEGDIPSMRYCVI